MKPLGTTGAALLAVGMFGLAPLADPPAGPAAALVFKGVTVIDVQAGRRLPRQTVVIVGHRIRAMGAAGAVRVPAGARVVDARGKFLIPGLWDLHVHPMAYVDIAFPLYLANGVTGVRDAGSSVPLATLGQWKREIAAGTRVGPRYLVSGPSLEEGCSQDSITRDSEGPHLWVPPALARYVVDSLKGAGADFIKIYDPSRAMHLALAAAARRVGILFGGHSGSVPGLEISDSGAAFLDHQTWFKPNVCGEHGGTDEIDPTACAAAAQRLRHNNTWVTELGGPLGTRASMLAYTRRYMPASFPWIFAPEPRSVSAVTDSQALAAEPASTSAWKKALDTLGLGSDVQETTRLHTAGVPIVVGTDMGIIPRFPVAMSGFAVPRALEYFVLGGMSALEALQTATLNPVLALRVTDSLGTVEAGKLADLVLLDADPLTDIWNTTKIRAVVANGRYFGRAALDGLLAAAERAARAH